MGISKKSLDRACESGHQHSSTVWVGTWGGYYPLHHWWGYQATKDDLLLPFKDPSGQQHMWCILSMYKSS